MASNKIKQNLAQKMSEIMPINEALSEIDFIIKEHLNINKIDLILKPNILNEHVQLIEKIIDERLSTRKPLQYILNKAVFDGDIYYVDENTLIPRPETEILVCECVKYLNSKSKILEIGTGSGCISISLAKRLQNDFITSCDISNKAIQVAKKNAKSICPQRRINFVESDLYSNINNKLIYSHY